MKIGLLLGSFNPITVAHVAMASSIINSELCDKVLFVVAKHNPWKKEEPAPFDVRCKMIESAIKPLGDACEVCRFEEGVEPPVYSYIPIEMALEKYGDDDEIFVIAGTDIIERIPKWKNYDTHIKGKVGFIEISRGSNCMSVNNIGYEPFINTISFIGGSGGAIPFIKLRQMDVSSTMVRNMVKNGMNPYPYVTEEVCELIKKYNLYK